MISDYVEEAAARQEFEEAKAELQAASLRFAAARKRLDDYLYRPRDTNPQAGTTDFTIPGSIL